MNMEKRKAVEDVLMTLKTDLKVIGIRYGHALARDRK